jgi:hypothetical protein
MDSRRHEGGADVTMVVSDMVCVEITAVVMEAKKLGGKGVEGLDNKNEECPTRRMCILSSFILSDQTF